jgi:hypothetical protein
MCESVWITGPRTTRLKDRYELPEALRHLEDRAIRAVSCGVV